MGDYMYLLRPIYTKHESNKDSYGDKTFTGRNVVGRRVRSVLTPLQIVQKALSESDLDTACMAENRTSWGSELADSHGVFFAAPPAHVGMWIVFFFNSACGIGCGKGLRRYI
jgi:hypothetical protein